MWNYLKYLLCSWILLKLEKHNHGLLLHWLWVIDYNVKLMVRWGENQISHSTSLVFSFSNRDCTACGTLIFKSSLHLKSEDTLISWGWRYSKANENKPWLLDEDIAYNRHVSFNLCQVFNLIILKHGLIYLCTC